MTTTIELTSHPVHAAGGLRMVARHLLTTVTTDGTTHPTRLVETATEVRKLVMDAQTLVGEDQHDKEIWGGITKLFEAAADDGPLYL